MFLGSDRSAGIAGGSMSGRQWHMLGAVLLATGSALFVIRFAMQVATLSADRLHWDFEQFYDAANALNRNGSPYDGISTRCGYDYCLGGYYYPPLLAECLRPIALLPLVPAGALWLVLVQASAVGALVLGYRMVRERTSADTARVLTGLAMMYGPLYESLYLTQMGTPVLLLTLLGARGLQRGTARAGAMGGAAVALAAALKLTPGVALGALVIPLARHGGRRSDWAPAAGATVTLGVLGLLMVAVTSSTLTFVEEILPRLSGVIPVTRTNISLSAMVVRVGGVLSAAPSPRLVTGAVSIGVVTMTGAVALRGGEDHARGNEGRLLVLGAFLAAAPLVSGIVWPHHLVTELAVFAALTVGLAGGRVGAAPRRVIVGLCAGGYVLTWIDRAMVEAALGALGWQFSTPAGPLGIVWVAIVHLNTLGVLAVWAASLLAVGRVPVLRARVRGDAGMTPAV